MVLAGWGEASWSTGLPAVRRWLIFELNPGKPALPLNTATESDNDQLTLGFLGSCEHYSALRRKSAKRVSNSYGEGLELSSEDESEEDLDDSLESDIATLTDYSFISTSENCVVFTMHRLVRLTVRKWLKACGQEEDWKNQVIHNLYV